MREKGEKLGVRGEERKEKLKQRQSCNISQTADKAKTRTSFNYIEALPLQVVPPINIYWQAFS